MDLRCVTCSSSCSGSAARPGLRRRPRRRRRGRPTGREVVDVTLRDFTIDPSTINVEPGTYTFHVVNDGATVHALEVEGPSGEVETSELEPGDSADLTVDLGEEGEYGCTARSTATRAAAWRGRSRSASAAGGAGDDGRRRPRTRTTASWAPAAPLGDARERRRADAAEVELAPHVGRRLDGAHPEGG